MYIPLYNICLNPVFINIYIYECNILGIQYNNTFVFIYIYAYIYAYDIIHVYSTEYAIILATRAIKRVSREH